MRKSFYELFDNKAIIGMIHLAGKDKQEKIGRAIEEIEIFEEENFNGAIIENYHGRNPDYVLETLRKLEKRANKLVIGINLLGYPTDSFRLADRDNLVQFIQIDSIHPSDMLGKEYNRLRNRYPNVAVFGGINFKYQTQETGEGLERELKRAMQRCEAIVTTSEGTGIETSIRKLQLFREIIGEEFPLISGAGVNKDNVYETLKFANGIINGSFLKDYDTEQKIKRERVKELMLEVKKLET